MQSGHPKELSKLTVAAFKKLVPGATIGGAVAKWIVDGSLGKVRVKRADAIANQVHVWRGEPIVVHVPEADGDEWYVLPVSWQLSFARVHAKTANQHASHAFDCMMVAKAALPATAKVRNPEQNLRAACEAAVTEARRKDIRFVVKAVGRARDAVADALISTFEEELNSP